VSSEAPPVPSDVIGSKTLEVMHQARRYNAWQYRRIAPYLGRRVCEIGSGIGNMSELLLTGDRELLLLTDQDEGYLELLRRRFAANPLVKVERLGLPDPDAARRLEQYRLDTVVALNVIEHIQHDLGAMATIRELLEPGGRFVMLVPAMPALYGSLDRGLGHVRRYTRSLVASRLSEAGLRVDRIFYFNLVGAAGWWFNARVLRREVIDAVQVRCFDALVPVLRLEDAAPLPFGLSLISVATRV
jgi:SAM-dependent methyltransferase